MIPSHVVGIVAAMFLAAMLLCLFVVRGWRAFRRQGVAFMLIAAGFLYSAATKPPAHGTVTFPYTDPESRYIFDAGSYVTNDAVHVSYALSPIVPTSAQFVGYARPIASTNADEWVQMFDSTFALSPSPVDIPFEGAISNNFQFFTTWTPGPSVHTNGVALVNWQRQWRPSINDNVLAPIRTGIYLDARRVAPSPGITNGVTSAVLSLSQTNEGGQSDE